ncbi:MAG: LytTR family transcriptional regulator [Bacteroidales bacterium]|nr:LytTR family transcriptional regulator [Bacteroidales bacterium]
MIELPKIRWKMSIYFGFFVFLFLYIFQPFGIYGEGVDVLIVSAGFGLVTLIIMLINHYLYPVLIPNYFNPDKWTIFRALVINFWFLFSISVGNYFFDLLFIPDQTHNYNLLEYFGITAAVGIFPSIILTFYMERKFTKEHDEMATDLNLVIEHRKTFKKTKELIFEGSGNDENLKIKPKDLVMVKSDGNYCDFLFLENQSSGTKTIRIPIKKVEEITQNEGKIMRVHRSFIINIDHISHISGNARNLTIHLTTNNIEVPISRSYEREVTNAIRHNG